MLADKTTKSRAGHYLSDRVYNGVQQVSKEDANVNREAVLRALRRASKRLEDRERVRVAS